MECNLNNGEGIRETTSDVYMYNAMTTANNTKCSNLNLYLIELSSELLILPILSLLKGFICLFVHLFVDSFVFVTYNKSLRTERVSIAQQSSFWSHLFEGFITAGLH